MFLAEKTDSSETNDDFSVDVDISLTKPPSFASSTKVMNLYVYTGHVCVMTSTLVLVL